MIAVRFYRDVLGLREEAAIAGDGGAHVTILEAGRATLEIANPAQKRMIDEVEVGRQVAPKYRVAFEVVDSAQMTKAPGGTRRSADHPVPGARCVAQPLWRPAFEDRLCAKSRVTFSGRSLAVTSSLAT